MIVAPVFSWSSVASELDFLNFSNPNKDENYEIKSGKSSVDGETAQRSCGRGRGRGIGRSRGCGHRHGGGQGLIFSPKPVWSGSILKLTVCIWQRDNAAIGRRIQNTIEMMTFKWFSFL